MQRQGFTFYFTVASGGTRKALRQAQRSTKTRAFGETLDLSEFPRPEHVMLSFATKNNTLWTGPEWNIDSGGYSLLAGEPDLEHDPEEYVDYLAANERRVDRAALPDYPCEPTLRDERQSTVREHQVLTINDHLDTLDLWESRGLDITPMPVVQGWTVEDYVWHADYYMDHGFPLDTVGIGSVCRRGQVAEVRQIAQRLGQVLPNSTRIHAFGIKEEVLFDNATLAAVDSSDSAAWGRAKRFGPDATNRWTSEIKSYRAFRETLANVLDAAAEGRRIELQTLGAFDAGSDRRDDTVYTIVKCPCGALIDVNKPTVTRLGGPCRKCERFLTSLQGRTLDPNDDLDIGTFPDDGV